MLIRNEGCSMHMGGQGVHPSVCVMSKHLSTGMHTPAQQQDWKAFCRALQALSASHPMQMGAPY